MFSSVQNTWSSSSPLMATENSSGRTAPHAIRLRAVQEWLKVPQDNAFAARLGVSPTRLANVYGGAPLGRIFADIIASKVGGSIPYWVWTGDYAVLPVRAAEELRACEAVVRARMEGKFGGPPRKRGQGTTRKARTRS